MEYGACSPFVVSYAVRTLSRSYARVLSGKAVSLVMAQNGAENRIFFTLVRTNFSSADILGNEAKLASGVMGCS